MTRPPHEHEDDETDEDFDPEGPDPSEMDASDEPDLEVCPHCRKLITEDADRCPHCDEYLTPGSAPLSPITWIVIVLVLLAMLWGVITQLF